MPSTAAERERLHVAVAAIVRGNHEVLLSQRPQHVHQGGLWEFPGGKLESGETVQQALQRELHEELGMRVERARPLIRIYHDYPDRRVLLDVWRIDGYSGEPHGREGQAVAWVRLDCLEEHAFPVANRPIIQALQLPSAYLITPDPGEDHELFLRQLERRLQQGIQLVQLRAPSLGEDDYMRLAERVLAQCRSLQARLLLNARPELVVRLGADGMHLSSSRLQALNSRPLPEQYRVIASCHNPEQLAHAALIGANAAVLSPVQATASHPDTEPLGWPRFADWVDGCALPVYALGGMRPTDVATAQLYGGQGIAAIRALWEAP
jgi:8-oxo-dGTP diphosphatase